MIELYINNTLVELSPGEQIITTKAVGRIGDFQNREGLITNDFEIPLTGPNTRLIGFHDRNTSTDSFPWQKQEAVIRQRGQELSRGFVQLVKVNQTNRTATISFYGDNTSWFSLLGAKSLRDLDLSAYNHFWDETRIVSSWSNTEGYIYPCVDPGRWENSGSSTPVVEDWFPAMFQKTLIEKIFSGIGYKVDGVFLNEIAYKNALIPVQRLVNAAKANDSAVGFATFGQYLQFEFVPPGFFGSSSTDLAINETNLAAAYNLTNETFVAPSTGTFTVEISGTFRWIGWDVTDPTNGLPAEVFVYVDYIINGTTTHSQLIHQTTLTNTQPAATTYTYAHTETQALTIGDTIKGQIRCVYNNVPATTTEIFIDYNVSDYQIATADLEIDAILSEGDFIDMAYNLPDITQAAFVRDMIVRHALTVTADNITKTVYFTPANTVLSNIRNAPDWTNKMDMANTSQIDFSEVVQDYGQITYFEYQEDANDVYLERYAFDHDKPFGRGEVLIDNGFIEPEVTFYDSVFAPTIHISTFIRNFTRDCILPVIPRYDADDERIDPQPRIIMLARVATFAHEMRGKFSIHINGTPYNDVPYAFFSRSKLGTDLDAYTEGLAWSAPELANLADTSLIDRWYRGIARIWNESRYIEVVLRLYEYEYQALDFTQPIYIDTANISGYFVIDEVEGYDGIFGTVKLIQVA